MGGGAVFDEDANGVRVGCGLPNLPGYVVSAQARVAELQVQPVPNPIYNIAMGRYNAAKAMFPDSIDRFAVMASALPSVLLVKQQTIETAEQLQVLRSMGCDLGQGYLLSRPLEADVLERRFGQSEPAAVG